MIITDICLVQKRFQRIRKCGGRLKSKDNQCITKNHYKQSSKFFKVRTSDYYYYLILVNDKKKGFVNLLYNYLHRRWTEYTYLTTVHLRKIVVLLLFCQSNINVRLFGISPQLAQR